MDFKEVGRIHAQHLIELHVRIHIPEKNLGNNENIGNLLPLMCDLFENLENNEELIIAELEAKTQNIINPVIAHVITR